MFELLFKTIKALFQRKDDPDINKKARNKQPPPKTKNKSPQKQQKEEKNTNKKKSEKEKKREEKKGNKEKKDEKHAEGETDEENEEGVLYFPLGASHKKSKEQKKKNKKQKKKEMKLKKEMMAPLFSITVIVILSINVIPSLLTTAIGNTITLDATITPSKLNSGSYEIIYDFEQDLNNLYDETKPGDKIRISDLLWEQTCDTKIRIVYINKEEGFFVTSLPREIENFGLVYSKYIKLKKPKRVKLTMKVTGFYQKVTDIEYLLEK